MEGIGFRFFLWLAGVLIAGAIILLIVMLIFSRALYAWGFFGTFFVFAIVMLAFGWIYDRRQAQRRGA